MRTWAIGLILALWSPASDGSPRPDWDDAPARGVCQKQLGSAICALERCIWAACVLSNAPSARGLSDDLPGTVSKMELEAAPVCYPRHKVLRDCLAAKQRKSCQWQVGGVWHIIQSDGRSLTFTLRQDELQITGRADLGTAIASVTGSLADEKFDVFVTWSATSRSRYWGIVSSGVIIGYFHDERHQDKRETWSGTGPATCVALKNPEKP